jgi:hypothetical protein
MKFSNLASWSQLGLIREIKVEKAFIFDYSLASSDIKSIRNLEIA